MMPEITCLAFGAGMLAVLWLLIGERASWIYDDITPREQRSFLLSSALVILGPLGLAIVRNMQKRKGGEPW